MENEKEKRVVNNYVDNSRNTIINIGGFAVVAVAGLIGCLWLAFQGAMKIVEFLRFVALSIAGTFREIDDTINDPELKPYFILMAILMALIVLGLGYLFSRFNLFVYLKNYFSDENDINW